jgi:hypothetical protein
MSVNAKVTQSKTLYAANKPVELVNFSTGQRWNMSLTDALELRAELTGILYMAGMLTADGHLNSDA